MTTRHALALASLLLVAGCAQQPSTPAPTEPAPSFSPFPTPSATAAAAPAQVFDGSCNALFTDAEVSAALGSTVSLRQADSTHLGDVVVAAAGGIDCTWRSDAGAWLWVNAVPEGVVDLPVQQFCGPGGELDGPICRMDATSDGIRLGGAVFIAEADPAPATAAARSLEQLFSDRAGGNSVAAPVSQPSFWHPLAVSDCEAAATQAGTALQLDLLGAEAPTNDAYLLELYATLRGGGLGCSTATAGAGGYLNWDVIGGGAWIEDRVAATEGTTEVSVPGLERVYLGPLLSTGYRYIDIFDGDNWMQAFVDDPDWAYPVLAAVVDVLNTP